MSQLEYIKTLRASLPQEMFVPDFNKMIILWINLLILFLGWTIARELDQWSTVWLWLYLPLAIIMGNSVIVLLFTSHDLLHGSVIKNPRLAHFIGLIGLAIMWMPPTLWKIIHNQKHHGQTNSLDDPDRSYLFDQANTWGKWIQNLVVPSSEVNSFCLTLGMCTAWGTHTFRHLTSVLLFNNESLVNQAAASYGPTSIATSAKKRRLIAAELSLIALFHLSILVYLKFSLLSVFLGYLLPIWIGYAGVIFYIYTNHLLCPMTELNDPLINSVSIKVPKIFDLLHFNFSHHTEHHLFPSINSDYYPLVQELLQTHYPTQFNLLTAGQAWRGLMQTPRHYQNEQTLTDWSGKKSVPCPCNPVAASQHPAIKE